MHNGVVRVGVRQQDLRARRKTLLVAQPFRERRAQYAADPKAVDRIIQEGSARARDEARKTLHEVRAAMHLDYFGL